mgnify:FL=1
MLARHRAERPPTATTPGSALTSTPAPANLVDRDFTAERPNEKWLTDISEIKARDGKGVPFAAGRLLRWVDPQGYVWSCINGVGLSPYREGPFANRNSWEWKLARARRLESVAPAFPMCKTCKFLPVCGGGCAYRNESIHPTCLRSIFENNELRILKEHLAKEYSYNCKTNMK